MPVLSGLRKVDTDEPIWFLDIEGSGQRELTTVQLLNPNQLETAAAEQLDILFPSMKKAEWKSILRPMFEDLTIIEMTEQERKDASISGLFETFLEEFCTMQNKATLKEEMLLGMIFEEKGRNYFRLSDLEEHLLRRNFRHYTRAKITRALRDIGGQCKYTYIKTGRGVNIWSIPVFEQQDESFELPDMGKRDPF